MTSHEAVEVVESLLRKVFPAGWKITSEPDGRGVGVIFKLFDEKQVPRHILGITDEALGEYGTTTALRSFLVTHGIREKLSERGRTMTWLSMTGWLAAPR